MPKTPRQTSDLQERPEQVSLMGKIYSSASAVYMLLGENYHNVKTCLLLVWHFLIKTIGRFLVVTNACAQGQLTH